MFVPVGLARGKPLRTPEGIAHAKSANPQPFKQRPQNTGNSGTVIRKPIPSPQSSRRRRAHHLFQLPAPTFRFSPDQNTAATAKAVNPSSRPCFVDRNRANWQQPQPDRPLGKHLQKHGGCPANLKRLIEY